MSKKTELKELSRFYRHVTHEETQEADVEYQYMYLKGQDWYADDDTLIGDTNLLNGHGWRLDLMYFS